MAIAMKSLYLILLSFSLQFLTYTTVTTAKETTTPATAWLRSMNLLRPRDDIKSFICQSNEKSPFNNHVIFGTNEMVKANGHHWCTQENRGGSQCVQLIDYGTASIAMCGEFKTKLRCVEIGEAIKELSRNCARVFHGKSRLAGRINFPWGYITIGQWRVPDPVKGGILRAIA